MSFDVHIFLDALTSHGFAHGAMITVALAFSAQATATVIGLVLALARTARGRPLRAAAAFYIWVFRAIPTLLWLLLVWNALPQVVPALRHGWFTPFLAGYIGLALAEGAYMAEIVRAALLAVDPGQQLAAKALGMRPIPALRHVVIPQVVRVAIPSTANELITLLKLTSLTSVISLQELLTTTEQQVSTTFRFAEYYAAAAVYYLVIVSVLMVAQAELERRYQWVTRASRWSGMRPRQGRAGGG